MTIKEMTDNFNKLSVDGRVAYLDYLKGQSQEKYKKFLDGIKRQTIQDFWNHERELIFNGKSTSNWTPEQIERIMNIDPNTGNMRSNARAAFDSGIFGSKPPRNLRTRDIEDCSPRANLTLKEIHILHYFGKSLS